MLEPLNRETLPEQVVRALKRFILEQQLAPGDQLPSERFLTELLGVSRTVVREALHTLVAEGLLVKEASRGIFVRELDAHKLAERQAPFADNDASNRNFMEVYAALEIGALAFVAQRITADELARLDAIVADMRRALDARQPIVETDRAFHDALLEGLHNPAFAYLKRLVQDAVGDAAPYVPLAHARHADRHAVDTAERIAAALRRRSADEAQTVLRDYLLATRPPNQARLFLFVDDGNVAEMRGVERHIAPAHKSPENPLIHSEYPWEGENVFPSATVLYDAERMNYQMWYHGSRQLSPREELCALCYATSQDGLHWTKPALDIVAGSSQQDTVDDKGARANNLVMPWGDAIRGDAISATILPGTAPGRSLQYSMLYLTDGAPKAGVNLAVSPDGLHWTPAPENPVDAAESQAAPVGDALICIAEPEANPLMSRSARHECVAYYRLPLRVAAQPTLGRMQSHDLRHWTGHRAILSADAQDPPDAELRGLTPFRYGDLTLGLLWVYRRAARRGELQLAASRDGVHWVRVGNRAPLLSSGGPEAFDYYGATRATIPIVVGNELWFYYAGMGKPLHSGTSTQRIGLATLTLDRFVALEAGREEGYVTTTPIDCSAQTQLLLNAVVNRRGYVLVEVLDGQDTGPVDQTPIPGYTREDAIPFDDNAVYHRVGWRDHEDLSALSGRPVRLRLILCRAALYGFRLAQPGAGDSDLLAGIC